MANGTLAILVVLCAGRNIVFCDYQVTVFMRQTVLFLDRKMNNIKSYHPIMQSRAKGIMPVTAVGPVEHQKSICY